MKFPNAELEADRVLRLQVINPIQQYTWKKCKIHNEDIPPFSLAVFLGCLICFVITDDQSIHVVEYPEFQQLCMILHKTLIDTNIPHREAVLSHWQRLFENLKLKLSVHLNTFGSPLQPANSNQKHSSKTILHLLNLLNQANVTLKIGHFTLDNAENNAVAMQELESLLAACKTAIAIISSMTSIPKPHISDLTAGSNVRSNDLDDSDNSLDGDIDPSHAIEQLDLEDFLE
ncbi:hypothetical protein V8E53_000031 [Lactarius tabidus]